MCRIRSPLYNILRYRTCRTVLTKGELQVLVDLPSLLTWSLFQPPQIIFVLHNKLNEVNMFITSAIVQTNNQRQTSHSRYDYSKFPARVEDQLSYLGVHKSVQELLFMAVLPRQGRTNEAVRLVEMPVVYGFETGQ